MLIMLFEQSRPIVFSMYVFMVVVVPPLSAYMIYFSEWTKVVRPAAFGVSLIVIKMLLLCSLISLIAFLMTEIFERPQTVSLWTLVVVFLAIGVAFAFRFCRWSMSWSEVSSLLDACLVVALAIAVFVLSPLRVAEPVPIGLLNYAMRAENFRLWLLLGIAWTAAGIWLRRREGWAFPRKRRILEALAVGAVSLVILGLYDDSHFVDFLHYQPLVGPAMHAMRGGTPMVDTYSQYGFLPWFIYRVAFVLFDPTFGTAAVLTRLINLLYFAVTLAILFFVSRRRLSALWFFVPALLVTIVTHITINGMLNMNALPMTLGGRYLLPATMTLLLIAAPARRWSSWVALGLIVLASLSSVDILALTLAPWGYCLLLESVRTRSLRHCLRWLALACAAIALAQAGFAAVIYLSTGAIVDYRPYFDMISRYRPNDSAELFWSLPPIPYYALWFPVGLAYFLVMAAASYRALRGVAPTSVVDRLLPVAVVGLGPLAYFFGRPDEATLTLSCLLFAVVAIGIAEAVFIGGRRFGAAGPALSAVMALAFAFTIADGFEHFMRPLDPSSGNASILRRCFTEEGCRLADVPRNIDLALHTQPLDPRTKVAYLVRDDGPRIEETLSMLRRLAPDSRFVGVLATSYPYRYADAGSATGLTAFMTTGQWFAWSLSSPFNDNLSALLTGQTLKRVAETPSGMLVIISNQPYEKWIDLERMILQELTARCRLSLVEKGKFHSAFRTENCAG